MTQIRIILSTINLQVISEDRASIMASAMREDYWPNTVKLHASRYHITINVARNITVEQAMLELDLMREHNTYNGSMRLSLERRFPRALT